MIIVGDRTKIFKNGPKKSVTQLSAADGRVREKGSEVAVAGQRN